MTPKLSDEQRHAVAQNPGNPIHVVDAVSQEKFVLLPEQTYLRVRALFDTGEFDIRETYAVQDRVADEAWSDPGDAEYDDYDAHRKNA
jgi:hypothetical protein